MCGRFTLTILHLDSVVLSLQAEIDEEVLKNYRPRYNIAPGTEHWILRSDVARRQVVPAHWGLVNRWSKDPSVGYRQINARAETLAKRPAYRDAFRHRRCAVPADGFYEWHGPAGARKPVWFHAPDRSVLLFAGLYEGWTSPDTGETRTTFTIITTDANEVVRPVHDRMPALLEQQQLDDWLKGDRPGELLRPAPKATLTAAPASTKVNSAKNEGPELLVADDEEPEPKRQLGLF